MRKRKTIAEKYFRSFENIKTISTPSREIIKYSANHLFPVKIDFAEIGISRNELMKQLRVRGILTQVHYIPINMQPFYQSMGHSETDTPNSLIFYNKILSLPIYPELTPRKQDYIIKTLLEIVI